MTLGRRGPAPHSTAQASAAQVIARAQKTDSEPVNAIFMKGAPGIVGRWNPIHLHGFDERLV